MKMSELTPEGKTDVLFCYKQYIGETNTRSLIQPGRTGAERAFFGQAFKIPWMGACSFGMVHLLGMIR